MATGNVIPDPIFTGIDSNGNPLSGGKLFAYSAGTTTPKDTYTSSALTSANANPVVLDSAGRATIFLSSDSYKFILKTSADVLVWEVDNVQAITLSATVIGENLPFFGDASQAVNDTGYASGSTADKLSPGTKILPLDSADVVGVWGIRGMLKTENASHAASAALVNLSDGSPDTAIVTITSTSTTGAVITSSAVTFAASGATKNYGIKLKSASAATYVQGWGFELVRTE
tara:strand:+ start:343 stop:1032 length:690 start_codon:yes stop_codon:yes gene_type:complete